MAKPTSLTISKTIKLTKSNYYSHDTDFQYMSFSVFKDFEQCEAATLAKLKGDWEPTSDPKALLIGNYVHSYFESEQAHADFISASHKAMMTNPNKKEPDGHLRADYKIADKMIKALSEDDFFNYVYAPGDKEVIVTGELFGHQWKGKIDSLDLDNGVFYDLKTTADFTKRWNEESRQREPFIYNGHYELQMAVYQQLIKQTFGKMCEPVIVGITKQTPPDMQAFDFESDGAKAAMANALEVVKNKQDHFWNVLMGEEPPKACGHCDYCRTKAHLTAPVPFDMYDWPE